jgi:hypothetical protein
MPNQPVKITFGEMREMGIRELLIYCADHKCSHMVEMSGDRADRWPDNVRLSDIADRFVCTAWVSAARMFEASFRTPRWGLMPDWSRHGQEPFETRFCLKMSAARKSTCECWQLF